MPLYLLDTDTMSLLERGDGVIRARIDAAPGPVMTSAVTVDEQVSGRLAQVRAATRPEDVAAAYRWLSVTVVHLGTVPILMYDAPAIARFGELQRAKLNVKKNDLRIAAIALTGNAIVVTRNRRDFERVPGLVVEDWSVPADP